jgi:hypothetical protein
MNDRSMDGFKVSVTRLEMVVHLQQRASFHRASAESLETKLAAVVAKGDNITRAEVAALHAEEDTADRLALSPRRRFYADEGSVAAMLAQGIRERLEIAKSAIREFEFYAGHVPAGVEVFILHPRDVAALEFVPGSLKHIQTGFALTD